MSLPRAGSGIEAALPWRLAMIGMVTDKDLGTNEGGYDSGLKGMCKCCVAGGDGVGSKTKNEMGFRFRGLEVRQCKVFTFYQCCRGTRGCGQRTFAFLKRIKIFDKLECLPTLQCNSVHVPSRALGPWLWDSVRSTWSQRGYGAFWTERKRSQVLKPKKSGALADCVGISDKM